MLRTNTCGELNRSDINEIVTLTGWVSKVRNLGSLVFVDLRDRYGITQIKISPELYDKVQLKNEYCIKVRGTVARREEANPNLPTGEIEVLADSIDIFAGADLTPFIIADKTDALEDTRLRWRYLDLRRPILQKNMMIRHQILKSTRDYLENLNFLEIETPTLIKSTPEGARDYLVPSRTRPGNFYALPQSPQIFKQLLMIGGMDRYYQIARCYRDEDLRSDRQPEFTQIDCEMSFITRDDVLKVIEGLVDRIWKDVLGIDLEKFTAITYEDSVNKYGTDKPDMRFGMLLTDLTDILSKGSFEAFKGKVIRGIKVPGIAKEISRKAMDKDVELAKQFHIHGVSFFKFENGVISGSLGKFYTPEVLTELAEKEEMSEGDVLIFGADESEEKISFALGALRLEYARKLNLLDPDVFKPCFVVDWPLFGYVDGRLESLSNPFTRPKDEDLKYIDSDPSKIKSYSYDTVINGLELSSGALRIYDGRLQQKVFELLGLTDEDIKKRFGFFVSAFNYGTPPHGGFALGVERLAMLLCKTDNVRDVVAFPKNLQAVDVMCQAPSRVPDKDLDVVGIQIEEKYRKEE